MKKLKTFASVLALGILLVGCGDDDDATVVPALGAGILSGGPFSFVIDGMPDMVSGITVDATNVLGTTQTFLVTDDSRNVLGIPPTMEALEGVNFDDAGIGSCYIYQLSYDTAPGGLEVGANIDDFTGLFDLSNFLEVDRSGLNAGEIAGGPFTFSLDGTPDMVSGVTLDNAGVTGSIQTYLVTRNDSTILAIPPTLEALEGINFENPGVGICLIWHLTYEEGLMGLTQGENAADLDGFFALSNTIMVTRNPSAGSITGGPFTFEIDGTPDMVSGISLDDSTATGTIGTWLVTDSENTILGIPPTLTALEENVDFDGAGVGTCLIWYLRYEEGLTGLEVGTNVSEFDGLFGLSNPLTVTRNPSAGSIAGGPFTFTIDDMPDMVSGVTLDDTNSSGAIGTFLVTDSENNILGIPPTLEALEGVDFNAAGVGTCLIWYLRYEEGLTGLEVGANVSGFEGLFGLSNSIMVVRE